MTQIEEASPSTTPCPRPISRGKFLLAAPQPANRFAEFFQRLAGNPANLLLSMLALNALFLPYRGLELDAVFYGAQVMNRVETGRFANDLFFRYGSQDSYSVFSLVVAPATGAIGIHATFLLLYLVTTAIFYWAFMRLVQKLIPDRVISSLALLAVAVWMVPVARLESIGVNENIFTPRLLANALVLFALERMLSGRIVAALVLLASALLLHPLMGFGGLLVFLLWGSVTYIPRRLRLPLALSIVGTTLAVLGVEPIGLRLLGRMDPAWREAIHSGGIGPYLLGSEWELRDWVNAIVGAALPFMAAVGLGSEPRHRDFLNSVGVVALLGMLGTVLVCLLPYALIFQGQPYRVLWLAQILEAPLALMLAKRWWVNGRIWHRLASVLLLTYLAGVPFNSGSLVIAVSLTACLGLLFCRVVRPPWGKHWVWASLIAGLTGVTLIQSAVVWGALIVHWQWMKSILGPCDALALFPQAIPPGSRLLLALGIIWGLGRVLGFGSGYRLAAIVIALAIQLANGLLAELPSVRAQEAHSADIEFVHRFLGEHPDQGSGLPTVYWPIDRVDIIWFDLNANSYYSASQQVGSVFSRGMALECTRRIELVRAFERDRLRRDIALLPEDQARNQQRLFSGDGNSELPTRDDLLKLCADRELDFVVARQGFPGLYAATNGTWFIYDCRDLRTRIGPTSHTPPDSGDTTGEQR